MTSRLNEWGREARVREEVRSVASTRSEVGADSSVGYARAYSMPAITPAIVDQGVEAILSEHVTDDGLAQTMRDILIQDPNSNLAQQFYHSKMNAVQDRTFSRVTKQEVTINYVLTETEVRYLSEYARELRISFRTHENHDHALAAACRVLDHHLVLSRLPPNIPMTDIGGNVMFHVHRGSNAVHLCKPIVDSKDPARHVHTDFTVRQFLRDAESSGASPNAVAFAAAYQRREHAVVCDMRVQDCKFQTPVLTAIHVYDVPMSDWPRIMENKGAVIVEGAMLFSNRFFKDHSGVMERAGARYEIDFAKDEFRMGFVGSPAWWYTHRWSEYMRYGADQIMSSEHFTYSYKIVERRGDTIFFRIMKLDRAASPNYRQYYELPDVDVVEVKGFQLSRNVRRAGNLVAATYCFPKPLWDEMVNYASSEYERESLDHAKMYNHYRSVAPRQTINAVLVMGGHTVPQSELMPLIVHASLAAVAKVMMGKRTTRGLTDAAMADRLLQDESTPIKVVRTFVSALYAAGWVLASPLGMLAKMVKSSHENILSKDILSWCPVTRVRPISVRTMMQPVASRHGKAVNRLSVHEPYSDFMQRTAAIDHIGVAEREPELAEIMLSMCGTVLAEQQKEKLQAVVGAAKASQLMRQDKTLSTAPPTYRTTSTVAPTVVVDVNEDRHNTRLMAIREAIEEAKLENVKTTSACGRAYVRCAPAGAPNLSALRALAEEFQNPDMWRVEKGVLMHSALGLQTSDFRHSAVYYPHRDDNTGMNIRTVHDRQWVGVVDGERVVRDYKVLDDEGFTGWVMTTDGLLVFNGPEIVRTMEAALQVRHDYSVTLQAGPPGCGKTTTIVNSYQSGDVVMCPVRESIADTRDKLLEKYPGMTDAKLRVRTVDSYLVNYFNQSRTANMSADVLRADECYMTHSGKWYAAAGLLNVKSLLVYGDPFQIPHVPRVQAAKLFVAIQPDITSYTYLCHRCGPSTVAAWAHVYDFKVRSTSKVDIPMRQIKSHTDADVPSGCVMLCMYQADKLTLRSIYSNVGVPIRIMTVHEAEGKTFKDVRLHRFDLRVRNDDWSLFDKSSYVLVAMSRHTHSFIYVCGANLNDGVQQCLLRASDARRVAAAADVSSAGEPLEFY